MKKIISAILAVLILICSVSFNSTAAPKQPLPVSAGIEALRNQFEPAAAPEANGYALDYEFYSPVGENDTTKYPIVIFLHGIGHGEYEGSQVDDSTMAYWSSRELQERWKDTGGAYIILPRSPENKLEYWNKSLINPLRALIDDFISKHRENVDTTRIFIGGSSAGGEMTWDMAISYPQYFAGIFPMAATGTRSAADIKKIKDVAVWVFASKFDPLISFPLNVGIQWDKICRYSSRPADCRLSAFGDVRNPDGSDGDSNHRLYSTISYDFFTTDGNSYPNVKTTDANGNIVEMIYPDGMISWMCSTYSSFDGYNSEPDITTGLLQLLIIPIRNVVLKIANVIQKLLGYV